MKKPTFSYPGGVWLPVGCNPLAYILLLEGASKFNQGTHTVDFENQKGGILVRFNQSVGLKVYEYIVEYLR